MEVIFHVIYVSRVGHTGQLHAKQFGPHGILFLHQKITVNDFLMTGRRDLLNGIGVIISIQDLIDAEAAAQELRIVKLINDGQDLLFLIIAHPVPLFFRAFSVLHVHHDIGVTLLVVHGLIIHGLVAVHW